jgi:tetratricopeptide (TPR) repeat protein
MATSVEATRGATPPDGAPALKWLITWFKTHRQAGSTIGLAIVVAVGLSWYTVVSKGRVEAAASQRLGQARLAFESKNYPLAASELSQIVENYSGTRTAQEANLLLGETRLYQGQTQQAIDLYNHIAPSASRDYAAQIYGLLAAGYENADRIREAAGAYEAAASHAQFPFQRAQYLAEAGRTWTAAGDTAKAVADYKAILTGMDSTRTVTEARVRIGELTRGAGVP